MNILQVIAERKISQAMSEGRLQIAACWKGRPLPEETGPHLPAELRMAYKILKNAGYLPPEVEVRREIQQLEDLLAGECDERTRVRQMKKLDVLLLKLDAARGHRSNIREQDDYYRRIVERVRTGGGRQAKGEGGESG
ncbi:MAG: DUF1992 domain-containing protein [Thermodesulfobacteriota bacterium]